MPIIVKGGSAAPFKLVPAGTHIARACTIVDLGTQTQTFSGETKARRLVYVAFEIPGEHRDDGRPVTIGQRYANSLDERSILCKHLESWRGKKFNEAERKDGFEIKNVLGKPCMLSVVHVDKGGKTYANINSISGLPAGVACPPAINAPLYLALDEFDGEVFERLPEGLKKAIEASPEYQQLGRTGAVAATADDDIPF